MNARSDIVFQINADVSGLIRGGLDAGASLKDMDKLVQVLDKSTRRLGQGNTELRARIDATTGVMDAYTRSAKSSAAAFEAQFKAQEKAAAAVSRIKASMDPAYAATMRYESAMRELDAAVEAGALSVQERTRLSAQLQAAMQAEAAAADLTTAAMSRTGGMSGQVRGQLQNFGYQVQDIAVQLQAGQSAAVVFAQQGSQILSAFGPVGVALGTLAAVTLPLLGAAFLSSAENGKSFANTISAIEAAQAKLDVSVRDFSANGLEELRAKYGEVNQEILTLIENQRIVAMEEVMRATRDAVQQLSSEMLDQFDIAKAFGIELKGGYAEAKDELERVVRLQAEYDGLLANFRGAQTLQAQADAAAALVEFLKGTNLQSTELFANLVNAEAALRQMAFAAPQAGWLGAAISEAATLANTLATAAQNAWAAATAGNSAPAGYNADGGMEAAARGAIADRGTRDSLVRWQAAQAAPSGGGGGGGGGGADPFEAEFLRLQESLKSQAELEMESFAQRQALLDEALEKRRLSLQDHATLMEQLQQQHQEKMTAIDAWRYGTGLDRAEAFFGGMADALVKGNDKMAKAGKAFAAAEALVNAWRAHNQTLADPSVPFFAKIPAALSILGAGLGAASAIKGTGGGGGGGGGGAGGGGARAAAGSAAPAQMPTQFTTIEWRGMGFDSARALVNTLNEAGRQGYRLNINLIRGN